MSGRSVCWVKGVLIFQWWGSFFFFSNVVWQKRRNEDVYNCRNCRMHFEEAGPTSLFFSARVV